jgi:CubicO group peptidase (beta-lactamase class C family)
VAAPQTNDCDYGGRRETINRHPKNANFRYPNRKIVRLSLNTALRLTADGAYPSQPALPKCSVCAAWGNAVRYCSSCLRAVRCLTAQDSAMNKLVTGCAAMIAAFALGPFSIAQVPAPSVSAETVPANLRRAPALNKEDFEAWLDGFMPYALEAADIAGAVIVLVKDGQVLSEKGYGFADVKTRRLVDPKTTLFRPGSISKLFTWTAVMQQVEAGKLDLDTDVNDYLDFKIPARDGKPITLRNLMTHTPGFADTYKNLFLTSGTALPLGRLLAAWTPDRIFPPGEVPAYSNYGAALAGYIVERASGEPFDEYVARHIFVPLQMQHSSFSQPLPPQLLAGMSSGYVAGSGDAQPYEYVGPSPAGSLAATGDDISHFMIAHLQDGQYGTVRILQPETARAMHAPQKQFNPPLNPMALGFYREDLNGHAIAGHAGDTLSFHSDLHLLLTDQVGLFISMNSAGKARAAHALRGSLLRDFMDRYFPVAASAPLPTMSTAVAHGKLLKGTYRLSRRAVSGFVNLGHLLNQSEVEVKPDGTLIASALLDGGGASPIEWREVRPFIWTDPSNRKLLVAAIQHGQVANFASSELLPAVMVFQPVPAWASASWNLPLLKGTAAILLLAALAWPLGSLIRRYYNRPFPLQGRSRTLYRWIRLTAVTDVVVLGAFLYIITAASSRIGLLNDALDPWLRVLQVLCLFGIVGAGLSIWNVVRVWPERGRSVWAKLADTLIMGACVAFVWFAISLQFLSLRLNY